MVFDIIAVAVILLCIALPISVFVAKDWLARPTRAQIEEESRRFEQRLLNPDFSALTRHFGHPFPQSVQLLYWDKEELLRVNFTVGTSLEVSEDSEWFIAFYEPADGSSVPNPWPGLERFFAFADDGSGNQYVIDPAQDDPAVLFHNHEDGALFLVCDHFSEFMKCPRSEVSRKI